MTLCEENDSFTLSGAPDMGAFEFGQALPSYGPCALIADFTDSSKTVNHATPQNGETVTFTIVLQNTGASYNEVVSMVDNLPAELSYEPNTLSASSGTIDDSIPTSLKWSGTPNNETTIIITYEATVNSATTKTITNTAVFDTGTLGTVSPTTTLIINSNTTFLPIILSSSSL